ncbi:MAG TPA: hypothetical protein VGO65_03630 [Pseudolysinimonas sp.]|jgi:hypothetical protein|nr:hypothetical protein [Schumannella sp.]HEV7741486.1 hypothetical protein [Pseudolysinimonas sp.]
MSRPAAAGIALAAAVLLYLGQSLLGSLTMGAEFGASAPGWGSPWWIGGALVFGLALGVGMVARLRAGITVAIALILWLVPPIVAGSLAAPGLAAAINSASLVVLFAVTLNFAAWIAAMVAILAVVAAWRARRRVRS